MERTERLLDVVALLLDSRRAVTWDQLREAFPDDYGVTSTDAAQRKFERDKTELHELGIPITWVPPVDEQPGGYLLDKAAYYLPEPGLNPEELAVLYAAGSAALASGAFPGRQDLAHALRKIGFFSTSALPLPKVRLEFGALADTKELPARLEVLWGAIAAKKSIDVEYFSPRSRAVTTRKVDPWGLALRRGLWSLVGYCHLRGGQRTFHVHRMRRVVVNEQRPRTPDFEVPADFSLDEAVARWPWQHRFHPPLDVTVELRGELAPIAHSLFPSPGVSQAEPRGAGPAVLVNVRATDLDGLMKYVLSLGAEARVVQPPEAVQRVRAMASRILERSTLGNA